MVTGFLLENSFVLLEIEIFVKGSEEAGDNAVDVLEVSAES